MGGQTSQTSTSSGKTGPWAPIQPFLLNSSNEADALFNAGIGSQAYTGSMATPFSDKTTSGMGLIEDFIKGPGGTWMQKPMQEATGMMDMLSPIARGDFSNDKTFMSTLGAAQEAAGTSVNQAMSDMGRYGGGLHQATMAKSIGDMTNDAMLKRQAWASDALKGYSDAMPGYFGSAMMPGQGLMQIGSNYEQLMANQINDQYRIFNEQQNKPWEALARYNAIVSGAGQLGSQTSGKATVPSSQPSIGQQALGFGLSALFGG